MVGSGATEYQASNSSASNILSFGTVNLTRLIGLGFSQDEPGDRLAALVGLGILRHITTLILAVCHHGLGQLIVELGLLLDNNSDCLHGGTPRPCRIADFSRFPSTESDAGRLLRRVYSTWFLWYIILIEAATRTACHDR